MGLFGGGGSSVDLASPSAIGSTTPNTGAFTTLSFAPSNNTTGFSNTGNSLTGSSAQSLVSLAQTWNTTGNPTAILLNVTNTSSGSSAKFLDLQVGGTSKVAIDKNGTMLLNFGNFVKIVDMTPAGAPDAFFQYDGSRAFNFSNNFSIHGSAVGKNVRLASDCPFGWSSGTTPSQNVLDITLARDAADCLAQRRTTNAQTFRLYRTYTDASNYERLALTASGTTRFSILAEKAGTGADRQIEVSFYTSASDPTSTDIASGCFGVWKNSGTGTIKLWANDGGTMKSVSLA